MPASETTKQPDRPRLDANIVVSCDEGMRTAVEELAKSEDRKVGQMARILLKEALDARGHTSQQQPVATRAK
jgi:hypothetical protein